MRFKRMYGKESTEWRYPAIHDFRPLSSSTYYKVTGGKGLERMKLPSFTLSPISHLSTTFLGEPPPSQRPHTVPSVRQFGTEGSTDCSSPTPKGKKKAGMNTYFCR